jgi:transcriptional regulator with XRE-family HTH domain
MNKILKTPDEIQRDLARKIRDLRLSQNISQEEITRRTELSIHAVQNLEQKGTASVDTLVRVLNVLGTDCSEIIPLPTTSEIDPIAIFERNNNARKRAGRSTR